MKLKRMLAMLLAFVLIAGLGIGILSTDAYAIKDAYVGDYFNWCIYQQPEENIDAVSATGCPPGMSLNWQRDAIFLQGTPTKAGSYTIKYTIYFDDGTPMFTNTLAITVQGGTKEKINVTKSYEYTAGTYYNSTVYTGKYGSLQTLQLNWNGLTLRSSGNALTLYGTPTSVGSYTFTATLDDNNTADAIVSVSVKVIDPPKIFAITKSPTKETKTEGESALFIAAADNYDSVEWIVKNKSGSETYAGKKAIEKAFSGISVSLYQDKSGRECMNLKNLPMSINGYYVQAKFTSASKSEKTTEAALLTVKEAAPDAPTIAGQSGDANLKPGEKVTLSVTAKSAEGTTLQYQWHCQKDSTDAADEVISGATASSYTPEERTGNTYYYCVVSAAKGGKTSGETVSEKIEVHYEEPVAEPEPEPAPEPEPEPEPEPAPEPTPAPTEVEKDNTGKKPVKETETEPAADPEPAEKTPEKSDHTIAFLIAGVVVVAMICGTVLYVVNKRKD